MTAISRSPSAGAHVHGYAKSVKGDTPAEGFEALFAALAGGALAPPPVPVAAAQGNAGEGGARREEKSSAPAIAVAGSPTIVPGEPANADPLAALPLQEPAAAAHAVKAGAWREIRDVSQALPIARSLPVVASGDLLMAEPVVANAAQESRAVQSQRVAVDASPPPAVSHSPTAVPVHAAQVAPVEPAVKPHVEAPSANDPPKAGDAETPASSAPRSKDVFSARALAQAALVEIVRSPGRPRTSPANDADVQVPEAVVQTAAEHARAPKTATRAATQPAAEQAIAEATSTPAANPTAASRAAADIARQRQFVLASHETARPANVDAPEPANVPFETLIALRKADGALDGVVPAPAEHETSTPAPTGAWFANLPAVATQTTAAMSMSMPRPFDQAAWSAALAQQVTAGAVAATRETIVRVEPEGLGPIEVRVSVHTERVDVRFAIEHPVTVNMVRAALPDLERLLAHSGLQLGDAQVAQQNAGHRDPATRSGTAAARVNDDDSAIAAPIAEPRPRVRVGLLDDFV